MEHEIKLLQFLICEEFAEDAKDHFRARSIHSNIYVPGFPASISGLFVVTCWRKDKKFHKEVIEYEMGRQVPIRTPHMDIEPVTDNVLYRWHKHPFPANLTLGEPACLIIRVFLDAKMTFESQLLIEKK